MTRLCPFTPKGLGGRACGEPLRDLGRDREGLQVFACRECKSMFVLHKRSSGTVVIFDRDAEGPDQ